MPSINISIIPVPIESSTNNPKFYKVIFHNNDKTSEELVVYLLVEVFGKSIQQAVNVMKMIERQGRGVVKTYNTRKEAVDKKVQCLKICKMNKDTALKIDIEER